MRVALGFLAASFLALVACGGGSGSTSTTTSSGGPSGSSSGGSHGSTGAAASSTGSPTGTGTGGATSTGTGTGAGTTSGTGSGGALADGQPCAANVQCQSGVCGVNGSGDCCSAACDTTDPTCGATSCNDTGACVYPDTSGHCGTDSCATSTLTQSACNGAGVCAAGTPASCPGNLTCASSKACNTLCDGPNDCVTDFYCESVTQTCQPQQATGPCTSNAVCLSDACDVRGTGNCCTAACAPTTDPACNPTSCDATSGACLYPQGAVCNSSCSGNTVTAGACDATGACGTPASSTCPGNLNCSADQTDCLASCLSTSDCFGGFYCSAGSCLAQELTGPCNTNDACTSGVCGSGGSGNCCLAACLSSDACGYTGCDDTGACTYPDATTACGGNCLVSTQYAASTCDGAGTCLPSSTIDCAPYACGPLVCLSACTDNTGCSTGNFCDTGASACCALAKGDSLVIDGASGDDTVACCGIGTNTPCQTLTHAMTLVHAAQVQGVTLNATVNGGGGDWTSSETYPVTLDWGVELNAPGVFFVDSQVPPPGEIFDISGNTKGDTLNYASIVGTSGNLVSIGFNSTNTTQTGAFGAIMVEGGATLYIANAGVNGSATGTNTEAAILVEPTATLTLAQDQSATITGTVYIGNDLGQSATDGYNGIRCDPGNKAGGGCTIVDATLDAGSSVVIQGQESVSLDAEDFSTITLTSNPVIGIAPATPGFGQCATKLQAGFGYGLKLNGFASVTFDNGTIQCIGTNGIQLVDSFGGNGAPTLSMDNTLVQNTEIGLYASYGTATVSNSTFQFNYRGVQQDTPDGMNSGTVDLTGAGVGGNTVVCSNSSESNLGNTYPGVDVYNTSPARLAADGVAWDTTAPDYFDCDQNLPPDCTCDLKACTTAAGDEDMNAVEDSFELGGITTTLNMVSGISCN